MTLPIEEARRLGIPQILIQSAVADGLLEQLIGSHQALEDAEPATTTQEAAPIPEANQPGDTSCLPLFDRNGLFVRSVSFREAARMVASGQAEAIVPGGWRERTDVEWSGVRLSFTPDPIWSNASLDHHDAKRIAGELGPDPDEYLLARAARIKLRFWPLIHDDRAPLVACR